MTPPLCRSCHVAPVIAVSLCQRCGQRAADADRQRRQRQERQRQVQASRDRRHWRVPAEPEDAA
jgi:hypothetical protein